MRTFVSVFIFSFMAIFAQAQTIQLKTQAQVNAMANSSASIHSLQIGSALDTELSDITDLTPLSGIHTLYGAGLAIVNNPHLKSLHGLENIIHINGKIIILKNDSITNLVGLPLTYSYGNTPEMYKNIHLESNSLLNSLDGLPSVQGLRSLVLYFNKNIQDISAMHAYSKLPGGLVIYDGTLSSLTGLDNLKTVGGISIINTNVSNLNGLGKLKELNELVLTNNPALTSLHGIGSIKSLETLRIDNCDALLNLAGLDSLKKIKNLNITKCNGLIDLNGLQAVDTIAYSIKIDRSSLISFHGLENVDKINYLKLDSCQQLTTIDQLSANLLGLDIQNCNNLQHINKTHATGNITIKNNKKLKSYGPFPTIVPFNARDIEISYNDSLSSVEGLMGLKRVDSPYSNGGKLFITDNPSLETLKGLDSLRYVGNNFSFGANSLKSINNLNSLDSLKKGISFLISFGTYDTTQYKNYGNKQLKTLKGLENLSFTKSIGIIHDSIRSISAISDHPITTSSFWFRKGNPAINEISLINMNGLTNYLVIADNPSLEKISGLNYIDTIDYLFFQNNHSIKTIQYPSNLTFLKNKLKLHNNPALTDISGLCPLFTQGTIAGWTDIHDNATGFNSVAEIQGWCMTPTEDLPTYDAIAVYPNPATDAFQIEVPMDLIGVGMMVDLVDISGTSHFSARIKNTVSTIPVDDLSPGLYFLRIVFDGRMVQVKKVVVER